jgi:Capsule assembly protein Wzi
MRGPRQHVLVCAGALLLVLPFAAVKAQSAGLVPTSDIVYADVTRLSDLGALQNVVLGQRPWSRREIARIARVAREKMNAVNSGPNQRLSASVRDEAELIIQRIESRFGEDPGTPARMDPYFAFLDGGWLGDVSTDVVRRGFPEPSSSPTEAAIDPLDNRRLGPSTLPGNTVSLELAQRLEFGDWLDFQVGERFESHNPSDSAPHNERADLLLGFMRARMSNVAVTVGRQQIAWGQRDGLGLFLASDAPALDGVSIAGDHPFALPGFLHPIGPMQATLVLADLGGSVSRSHSKLLAYKVSVAPNTAVEFGGTFMNHFGGEGGRSSSFTDHLIDFLPFVDVFRKHNYTDTTHALDVDSDKLLGMDGRVRLNALAGITIAGEFLIDDFDVHRLKEFFTEEGSQTLRVIAPSLWSSVFSAEFTAIHMGPLTYTHTALLNGITTRGRLLGNELGPDAKSFGLLLRYLPSADARLELEGRNIQYSNNVYAGFYATQTDFEFRKISDRGTELRDVLTGSLVPRTSNSVAFRLKGGGERIRNADWLGVRRYDYQAQISLELLQ